MVSVGGKTGKTDSNRGESAANRNREPVGELARARPYATHSDLGPSHPDAKPSANMPRGGPKFANRRSRTRRHHVRAQPVRRQPRNNALGASIKLRRNGLSQRGYLRDLHAQSCLEIRLALHAATAKPRFPRRAGPDAAAIARTSI